MDRYEILNMRVIKEIDTSEEIITKFGGQPDWIDGNKWPVDKNWRDRPMMFIGQIVLNNFFGDVGELKVAYIFATYPNYEEYYGEDYFYDPDVIFHDEGANMVIIQPENKVYKFEEIIDGPTVYDENNISNEYIMDFEKCKYDESLTSKEFDELTDEEQTAYIDTIGQDKIGGTPYFFSGGGEELFTTQNWKLLLQLNCDSDLHQIPFQLCFGSMALLSIFVTTNYKEAVMMVQI